MTRVQAERLARMILRADDDTLVAGLDWYPKYHDFAQHIGRALGCGTRRAAGIIAALSPGVEAEQKNIHVALAIGEQSWDITDLQPDLTNIPRRNIVKALRMRDGEDPENVFDPRTAPKTTCFFHNIWDPRDDSWVTIDGRMADLIVNEMRPWKIKRGIHNARTRTSPTLYETYEETTRYAARIATRKGLPMNGVEAQAVLWTAGKQIEMAGLTTRGTPRKQGPHRKGQRYT